jgi:hypothetical protein
MAYDPDIPSSEVKLAHWLWMKIVGAIGEVYYGRLGNRDGLALDASASLATDIILGLFDELGISLGRQLKDLTQGERARAEAVVFVVGILINRYNIVQEDPYEAHAEIRDKVLLRSRQLFNRLVADG